MNTNSPSHALVLGGGGGVGNAWLIGVVAGLYDGGMDVTDADLVVGTSAGATAAAQLTGSVRPPELFAQALVAPLSTQLRPAGPTGSPANHLDELSAIIASADSAPDMRRRLGAARLAAAAGSEGITGAQWRATVEARLPGAHWPDQLLMITAIDAHTGDGVVFDRNSGVDLIDAVAATTSNGFGAPPYAIGDHRYLDGGYRRNENVDLAAGYGRVLVLSPLGGRTLHPLEWGMQLDAQVDELRASGSIVGTILPDRAALDAFAGNMMNPAARPPAARAGFEQGKRLAPEIRELWG